MDIDRLFTREDLARELKLDPSSVNFKYNVLQATANLPANEIQKILNKFFPKFIGSNGSLNLHVPVLLKKGRSTKED